MSLERYCRDRVVALSPDASAYACARAMAANHVGAVIVQDRGEIVGIITDRDLAIRVVGNGYAPQEVPLHRVMTAAPDTIPIEATDLQAAELMRSMHERRLIITEDDRLAGIVTLDDLIISGAATPEVLRDVVSLQLSEAGPNKPEGFVRPPRLGRGGHPERSVQRRRQTLRAFEKRLMHSTGIDDPQAARDAFDVVVRGLVRRLTPAEANDFVAQLPAEVREPLLDLRAGPDRRIDRASIEDGVAWKLDVDREVAAEVVRRVAASLSDFISEGELEDVRAQLPEDLRPLISHAA